MPRQLLFDIGNTSLKIGISGPGGVAATYSFPTALDATPDSLGFLVTELCRQNDAEPREVDAWVISSVVPHLTPTLRAAAERYCGCTARFVPTDLPLPIENRYERPGEVGADRLVTAFAAQSLFTAASFVVVDFGTATTFDCVLPGAYLGGLICPGILSSAAALSSRTAKLPQATLEVGPGRIEVGKSTAQSLNQGLVHGFAAMTEGLAARLKAQLPEPCLVIATGGFAPRIARACPAIDQVRPDLLMEGLRLAHGTCGS